jgi:hypothetical protein
MNQITIKEFWTLAVALLKETSGYDYIKVFWDGNLGRGCNAYIHVFRDYIRVNFRLWNYKEKGPVLWLTFYKKGNGLWIRGSSFSFSHPIENTSGEKLLHTCLCHYLKTDTFDLETCIDHLVNNFEWKPPRFTSEHIFLFDGEANTTLSIFIKGVTAPGMCLCSTLPNGFVKDIFFKQYWVTRIFEYPSTALSNADTRRTEEDGGVFLKTLQRMRYLVYGYKLEIKYGRRWRDFWITRSMDPTRDGLLFKQWKATIPKDYVRDDDSTTLVIS